MPRKTPIFYSVLLLTAVNLLLRLIGTSFQVYLSGRIGAAGIGLLQLIMSVGGLAMTLGMAGIRTATMYLTAEALGRKQTGSVHWVLSGCFLYSILCSCAVATGLYIAAPWLAEHWLSDLRTVEAIRIFAAFLPVSCLCGVMTGYFTAANRIGTLAAVQIAEQICAMTVTLVFLFLWAGADSAKACQCVVLGNGVGNSICLILLFCLRLHHAGKPSAKLPVCKPLLRTAVPLALADAVKSGISTTENLIVPKRLARYPSATDPLATFGTVCGMVFPVLMFPAAILYALAELLIPELARCAAAGSKRRIYYLVGRSLRVAMLYGCMFCGLLYLLAEPLCLRLYESLEAGVYLRRFSLLVPMLYCDAITDAMTKGLGQQTACVRYNILTSAMDVALLFILLPRYGMGGYFFSFLLTHLINFLLSLRRLVRITGFHPPLRHAGCTAVATAAAVLGSMQVGGIIPKLCLFFLLFFALLQLLQVISKADIRWIKGLIKAK